jgi:transcriptional regulator with XRE-family HTH domain
MAHAASLPTFATFGEMLRYLHRQARLTQRELAIAVGYSESMISRLEHGERPPDVAMIHALFVPALQLEKQPEVVVRTFRPRLGAQSIRLGQLRAPSEGRVR